MLPELVSALFCNKLALLFKVKVLPESTVNLPSKVTVKPEEIVTTALLINRNEQPAKLAPIVPEPPLKITDLVVEGVPFDQVTPPSVEVVASMVTTAEPEFPEPKQPFALCTETRVYVVLIVGDTAITAPLV